MKSKNRILITLPEKLADWDMAVKRDSTLKEAGQKTILVSTDLKEGDTVSEERVGNECVFVWKQDSFQKVAFNDILWIEADGSYSILHLTQGKKLTVSFNLAVVEKDLPASSFMRIHRSYIINMNHADSLIGNSFLIGNKLFTIGREYRKRVFNRIVTVGTRRKKKE